MGHASQPFDEPTDVFQLCLEAQRDALAERLLRLGARERELLDHEAVRATLAWDDDRRADAAELGAGIARRPEAVRSKLGRSRFGCLWLIARWEALQSILESHGSWDEAQVGMAFDLLGTPKALRVGHPWGPQGTPHALVAREIAALRHRLETSLDELDEADRVSTEAGMGLIPSALRRALKAEENACWRRFQWVVKRLDEAASRPADETVGPPEAETAPIEVVEPAHSVVVTPRRDPAEERALEAASWWRALSSMSGKPGNSPNKPAGNSASVGEPTAGPRPAPRGRRRKVASAGEPAQGH